MKKHFKQILSLILIPLIGFTLIPSGVWAQENPVPELEPLNPVFIEYQSDLESGEINSYTDDGHFLGHIPEPVARVEVDETFNADAFAALPSTYDLRETGRINPVRDQGRFGSCWAFASLASLETYLKEKETVDLSENNMMWNHRFDWNPYQGGNTQVALAYLSRWSGPISEHLDPYGTAKKYGLTANYHIQSAEYLPNSANIIKQAIMDGGALYNSIYGDALGNPTYYNQTNAALYYDVKNLSDVSDKSSHAVAIVGWDDNYSRTNFNKRPPGDGAWIIRNSWGSGWGDNGYFYLSYYDTYAGHNATAFHNAESTENYKRSYQYDDFGKTANSGFASSSAWGANIFTAVKNENLTAISTYGCSPNTTVEIQIYTDLSSNQNPTSGQLRTSQIETFANEGYYTVDLDTPVNVMAAEKFSVVVKYTTPQMAYPIPVEYRVPGYSSGVFANYGESFVSPSGAGNWTDYGYSHSANVCIKAFTGDQAPVATLQSINITKPANKLIYQIGESLDLTGLEVTGIYSDGSQKNEAVRAQNVTGFDSSKANAEQFLTITIAGKTTSFMVQIVGETYLLGDVDDNGKITTYDAQLALQFASGLKVATSAEIKAADVDSNGVITVYDALRILQYATGKIKSF